jgi:hypothetical protein
MIKQFDGWEIEEIAVYGPHGLLLRFSGKPGDHVKLSQMVNKREVWSTLYDVMDKPEIGDHKLDPLQMSWIEWWRNEIMGRAGFIDRDPYTGNFNDVPEPKA